VGVYTYRIGEVTYAGRGLLHVFTLIKRSCLSSLLSDDLAILQQRL